MTEAQSQNVGDAPASAVVCVYGADGVAVGAGFLAGPDLVLTCAHVVSDALGLPREKTVAVGAVVAVDFPLVQGDGIEGAGPPGCTAEVERWIPIRPDGTGDLAVLRLSAPAAEACPLPMAEPGEVWNHQARVVGFTGGEPRAIWFLGTLSGATSEGWFQLSRANGQATHIKKGFSGSPVWDIDLGAVVGLVVAAQPEQDAQQAFVLHTGTLLRELPDLAPAIRPVSPFRGLATFQEDDAGVFFGREDDVREVITALRGVHPAVTLYGPSGCGKSSLALAGVAPRMQQDGYDVLVVDAGKISSPRTALSIVLYEAVRTGRYGAQRVNGAEEVESLLAKSGLADTLHSLRGGAPGRTVVVLDQAEALLDRTGTEVDEAVELLFPQHRPQEGPRVLVTLRADFMDAMLKHPCLGPALRGGRTLPLTPMSPQQLSEVIRKPIERIPAVEYDPGLDQSILDDAGGEPGILPLLGFVLQELWDRRVAGRLRATAYEEMGGVSGALERHAEQTWRECVAGQPESEAEALRLLTGLVRVLPGSETPLRRRLTRQEAGETRWRLARAFAERRLLVLHGDEDEPETAELAHEALVTAWPALRQQVKADAEFLAARAELGHDLDRWERGGRSTDLLAGTFQLASLRRRLGERERELTSAERDFLTLARQRQRAHRIRARAAWTAVALVFALIVGLSTFLAYQEQVSAARDAESRSRALADLSDQVSLRDPGLAALTAMAGYDVSPTHEARSALMRQYAGLKHASWVLSGVDGKIRSVATSNDGQVTLVATRTGRATLFVRGTGGKVVRKQLRLAVYVTAVAVSRDGRRIAYLSAGFADLHWHDVNRAASAEGDLLGPERTVAGGRYENASRAEKNNQNPYGVLGFSPDGSRAATVSADGRLWLWDLETSRNRVLTARVKDVQGVWFGADEDTLVVQLVAPKAEFEAARASMAAVDIGTGRAWPLVDEVGASDGFADIGMSGDGSVLVSCGRGADAQTVYRAVRVADGRERRRYEPELEFSCDRIAVDRAGDRFAYVDSSKAWTFVDTERGGGVEQALGGTVGEIAGMPIVGDSRASSVVAWTDNTVLAQPVITDVFNINGSPALIDKGDRMVVREGQRGERLALVDSRELLSTQRERTAIVAQVDRGDAADPSGPLEVNSAETLLADLVAPNRIVVRAVPSLRKVTEITTAMPPLDDQGKAETLEFNFLDGDEFMTVSGSVVEQWNVRDGRRSGKTIDLRDLGLTEQTSPKFTVARHPKQGHIQVSVEGEGKVHAVDRGTGKENKAIQVRFSGEDFVNASLTKDGRHAVVLARGRMLEVWSVPSGGRAVRVFGPFGPLDEAGGSQLQPVGTSQIALANANSVRFLHYSDLDRLDSYDFVTDQSFFAMSRDGRTLMRTLEGGWVDLFRLDPELWKRHLCDVLGRELTEDERRSMPSGLPEVVCPV
ncbi:nSTAND1 domain-containing NTPase [Streptomyces umbrinus]